MSWTDSNSIQNHLIDLEQIITDFKDIPIRLDQNGEGQLPHNKIVTGSDKVKQLASVEPTGQASVTLNSEVWEQLTYDTLIPNQMVVADDDGLQNVYLEGIDFVVNYADGKLRRISGGSISDGGNVQIYYQRYSSLTRNVDYTIDYDSGEVAVKAGGSLEADTLTFVDYQISASSGVDNLISQAITEAEDKILTRVKDDYDGSSTDQGLISGATELSLSILCRALASRALSDGRTSAEGRARAWRELASAYETTAWITLRPFMKIPAVKSGNKKANQSWEWI